MTYSFSSVSLGCSRLGSLRGLNEGQSLNLLDAALRNGINFFDTATSYGQGSSEGYLGKFYKSNPNIFIATKVGKVVPFKAKLIQPVKSFVQILSKNSTNTSETIKKYRGDKLGTNFDLDYLSRQLDSSRKRLKLECIPVVYLHSPSDEIIHEGGAVEFLYKNKKHGNIGLVGVSVDDILAAEAALLDDRIDLIQLPLLDRIDEMERWLVQAEAKGKFVVVREVLRQIDLTKRVTLKEQIRHQLKIVAQLRGVKNILIGTTNESHLLELMEIFKNIRWNGVSQ